MSEHAEINESIDSTGKGRRNFLKICSVALSSHIGIGYAIPLIRAFISPAMQKTVTGSSINLLRRPLMPVLSSNHFIL